MSVIKVDIVSAENQVFSGEAVMVFAPAAGGEVGILPKHMPFLAMLKPGEVRVRVSEDEEDQYFFVAGGFVEVQPDHVMVLADVAIRAHDLDEAKIKEAKQRAEEAMETAKSDFDVARAESELALATAQIKTLAKLRNELKTKGY